VRRRATSPRAQRRPLDASPDTSLPPRRPAAGVPRGDTGTWALPGGTLEWGETLTSAIEREMLEEAGVERAELERVVGVYSRPDRDPRFHAVTVCVALRIDEPRRAPMNGLEIREVRLFAERDLPGDLALGMNDMLAAARRGGVAEIE
jgi:8-oxo-dGTP diphosphatase